MTKNIKEKAETSHDVSGGTVEPRPVSIKEPFKHSSASKVENTAQKDVKSAEINTMNVIKTLLPKQLLLNKSVICH